jgi:4-amino-4-deoxy-L-arabinose transferase-like glycosyltransferase
MPTSQKTAPRRLSPLIWLSFAFALLVALMVPYGNPNSNERWETLFGWLLSMLLFCAGVLHMSGWKPPSWQELTARIRAHRVEIAGVIALVIAAFIVRVVDLEQLPYAFANDEGWIGVEGRNLFSGQVMNFFQVGWSAQPMLSFLPDSFSILLFGSTIFAVRLVSAVEGTLTVLFLYLGGREVFGRRAAFMAAGILAALPVHIHFSRTAFNNIIPGLFAALLFWLVFRALRTGKASSYLWAGLAAGFAFYSYLGSRLAILLAAGILGFICLAQRGYLRAHLLHLIIFTDAFLIVAGPQLSYFMNHPDYFMSRISGDGILQNGWLEEQAAPGGPGIAGALANQLEKSTLVYISDGAPYGFYNSPRPYLPPVGAALLFLGTGFAIIKLRKPAFIALLAWFWSVILLGGMLTTSPPASQRLVMGFPAAAMLVAIGLDQSASLLSRLPRIPKPVWTSLAALVVLACGIDGLGFYFGDYRQNGYYGDASNELIYESSRLAKQIGPGYQYVLLGAPRVFLDFANFNYLMPEFDKSEIGVGDAKPLLNDVSKPSLFIAIPERVGELNTLARDFPGGTRLEMPRRFVPGQVLFDAYILPPIVASSHGSSP